MRLHRLRLPAPQPYLQVQLLSMLRVLKLKGIALSPPQESVNHGPCQNHRQVTKAPCLCKCKVKGTSLALGILQLYLNGASTHQHHSSLLTLRPCGWNVSSTSSMSFSARTAGVNHSHERKKERKKNDTTMVYILKILSPATFKVQSH